MPQLKQRAKKYQGNVIGINEACEHYGAEIKPMTYRLMSELLLNLARCSKKTLSRRI